MDTRCECQNCDWTGPASELEPLEEAGIFEIVSPGEIMPHGRCPQCGAVAHEVETPTAEDQWRNLALQFDGHRIEALSLLRYVSEAQDSAEAADRIGEIKAFLSKPPLSGEAVLAERIRSMTVAPEATATFYAGGGLLLDRRGEGAVLVLVRAASPLIERPGLEVPVDTLPTLDIVLNRMHDRGHEPTTIFDTVAHQMRMYGKVFV